MLTDPSLPYENYWPTSKLKTNLRTHKEQLIRSNAATARPPISVRPAEIWTLDWLNTDERRGTVTSTITLLNTIYRQTTQSTGTLLPTDRTGKLVYRNLKQTPIHRCLQLPAPNKLLIDDTNNRQTTHFFTLSQYCPTYSTIHVQT